MATTPWRPRAGAAGAYSRLLAHLGAWDARAWPCAVGVSLLLWLALFILQAGKSFRLAQTLTLYRWPVLQRFTDLFTTDAFINTSWKSPDAGPHKLWYALVCAGLVAAWGWALWLSRPGGRALGLRWILAAALLFSAPLVLLPGMTSGDLYLYDMYGRVLARYGENPLLVAPSTFPTDPHLPWVYWKWLPSAYGPVWLMFSGGLSALAGDAVFATVFTYKAAVVALHALTTGALWLLLRRSRPELATWGAVFYSWNPLVLFETAGAAHNEVMAALFVALSLLAVALGRRSYAVFFLTAGVLVKLTVLLFLPLLALAWLRTVPDRRARVSTAIRMSAVAVLSGLALYAPLWAGTALIENTLKNPAATRYQNTLWELLALRLAPASDLAAQATVHADLDLVRNALFAGAYLLLARAVWRGMDLASAWTWAWVAFCLSAAYVWPWYFVLPVATAAVVGPGRLAVLGGALSLGGMLFWLGWPDPPLPAAPWVYHYRSALMLAPALAALALPLLRGRLVFPLRREAVPQ